MNRATVWMTMLIGMSTLVLSSNLRAEESIVHLPEIRVGNDKVRVHTQGLFVTEKHFLVTGRLESKPKRALLFRFSRQDPSKYEFVDLTPTDLSQVLDHPGGFDRDKDGVYWIPVSTSNPKGPTVIYGLTIGEQPLTDSLTIQTSIRFPDHLGALCCVGKDLLVANWDTKKIYRIRKTDGKTIESMDRSEFIADRPDWFLAVQDWKYDSKVDRVVAGGIDKSPNANRHESRSVVSWIDLGSKSVESTARLAKRKDVARPMTNEGLALFGADVFLLPEDLGAGAKIFQLTGESLKR